MSREHLFHQSAGAPACDGTCGSAAMARWQPLQGPGWDVQFDQFWGLKEARTDEELHKRRAWPTARSQGQAYGGRSRWESQCGPLMAWGTSFGTVETGHARAGFTSAVGLTPCGGRQALAGTGSHPAKRLQGWDGWLGGRVEVQLTAGGRLNHRRQRRHRVGIELCTVGLLRYRDQRHGQHSHEHKHKHERATYKSYPLARVVRRRQPRSCEWPQITAEGRLVLPVAQSGRACGAQRVAVEIALSFSGLSLSGAGAVRYSHETPHILHGWSQATREGRKRRAHAGNDGLGAFGYRGSWSVGRSIDVSAQSKTRSRQGDNVADMANMADRCLGGWQPGRWWLSRSSRFSACVGAVARLRLRLRLSLRLRLRRPTPELTKDACACRS